MLCIVCLVIIYRIIIYLLHVVDFFVYMLAITHFSINICNHIHYPMLYYDHRHISRLINSTMRQSSYQGLCTSNPITSKHYPEKLLYWVGIDGIDCVDDGSVQSYYCDDDDYYYKHSGCNVDCGFMTVIVVMIDVNVMLR